MTALVTKPRMRTVDGLTIAWSVPSGARIGFGRWNGEWQVSTTGAWLQVTGPQTGELLGYLTMSNGDDVDQAVGSAHDALATLAGLPIGERAALCRRIGGEIRSRRDNLAGLLSLEHGKKPDTEARAEIDAAAAAFEATATEADFLRDDASLIQYPEQLTLGRRQALGVVALITGSAYPVGLPAANCLAASLASGSAVVWHPASTTSLVSAELIDCMIAAGLPDGAVCLVTGDRQVVAPAILRHDAIDGAAVLLPHDEAKQFAAMTGGRPVWREERETGLAIVSLDADIEAAATVIARRTYGNSGQLASASARILVHAAIHDRFVTALCEHAFQLGRDNGLAPVNNASHLRRLEDQLADARTQGGRVIGETVIESPTGLHISPMVVSGIEASSRFNNEGSYGPVAPVVKFQGTDEMRFLARCGYVGHSVAVFTRSPNVALDIGRAVGARNVGMNESQAALDPYGYDAARIQRQLDFMSTLTTLTMRMPRRIPRSTVGRPRPSWSIRRDDADEPDVLSRNNADA